MPIDTDSLGKLLDRHWPILVAWVGGERTEAEDVVQQAFIKLAQEETMPDNCAAWLFTVSKRLAINPQVSRKKRQIREKTVAAFQSQNQAGRGIAEFEIHDLLNQLASKEREVVIAKVWGGLTLDEISVALGTSTATVWRIYQTGVARLKELLGVTDDKQLQCEWGQNSIAAILRSSNDNCKHIR